MDLDNLRKYLSKVVIRAQHCQRNWNLEKQIPQEDLDLMIHSVTQCPSKQNMDFYEVYVIQDREIQEKIYQVSDVRSGGRKNPQLLANALFVFVEKDPTKFRHQEAKNLWLEQSEDFRDWKSFFKDQNQSVGVAAGFLNMIATSLGYSTGCNTCMDKNEVAKILVLPEGKLPILAMGIGFKDEERNRRKEHVTDKPVETFEKADIPVHFI
jgi:nitroreductase